MQNRHTDRQLYFNEQEITTGKHVIPYIEKFMPVTPGMRILEVGCGEGGNLKPFLARECKVTGVDISEGKITLARNFFAALPESARPELICDDIYNLTPHAEKYDLVLMRDVIEHIHDQERFLFFIRQFMHKKTIFFLGFPPWQNPFGGHQQVCRNRLLSHLPYFHLLPAALYKAVLKMGGESENSINSLLEIKETGLSTEHFEKIFTRAGYTRLSVSFFLINPNYEVKFGLKPVKQCGVISRIPHLRNYFTTSVFYLLTP